jgi:glycosyltransferase involved in cell wall biosynthesis
VRIVMDITTTLRWTGHDVGITRVERNCAIFLGTNRDLYPDLQFVRQTSDGSFSEVDRDAAVQQLSKSSFQADTQKPRPASPASAAKVAGLKGSVFDWVLRSAKKSARFGYFTIESRLPSVARADFRAGAIHANQLAKAVVHESRHSNTKPVDIRSFDQSHDGWSGISATDVYVSMGLDWDDKSLLRLYRLRRQHGFRTLLMCYDLIPVLFPEWMPVDTQPYDRYFSDLLHTADAVSCISVTTRDSLRSFALSEGLPEPQLETVRLGADFPDTEPRPVETLVGEPFVLFVSTLEPRKNHLFALELWKRLAKEQVSVPKLVFVGRFGWKHEDLLSVLRSDPSARANVVHLESVTDNQLAWLYEQCMFTLYPSIYEGWGLPVVESILAGKLCVTSTAGAIMEAGHNLATHIDLFDGVEWLTEVGNLVQNPGYLAGKTAKVVKAQHGVADSLSWDSFGRQIGDLAMRVGSISNADSIRQ